MGRIWLAAAVALAGAAAAEDARNDERATTFIVFFDYNQPKPDADAAETVALAAKAFEDEGARSILVEGHTDNIGSANYNQKLSEMRAEAIRDMLVEAGVPEAAIQTVGHGFEEPLVPTEDGVREPQNRRVFVTVQR